MLRVKLPFVHKIHPQSNSFVTSLENKATNDSKLNDNPASISFALNLMALSRVKQATHSSSGEKKNMLCNATRSVEVTVAQLRMSKFIGAVFM